MDFSFSRAQLLARDTARTFARSELAPYAQEWDEHARFPKEAIANRLSCGRRDGTSKPIP